jgi:hypothetical protein
MSLYITNYINGASSNLILIFPKNDAVLTNTSRPHCSYYTSGSNISGFSTPGEFLDNLAFSNTYSNVQAGLTNITRAISDKNIYLRSNASHTYTFSNSPDLVTYIATLKRQIRELAFVANCVTEQADFTDDLYSAKESLALSKERYDQMNSPETHVSYYEGTFPIYRPVGQTTLFVLFGVGLFLMLLSLLCFMRTQGIELQVVMPQSSLPGISSLFAGQGTYIGIASVVGIVLGYFLHVYYK